MLRVYVYRFIHESEHPNVYGYCLVIKMLNTICQTLALERLSRLNTLFTQIKSCTQDSPPTTKDTL